MSDDVRHEDFGCPLCGEWNVMYQECYAVGCDEGQIDGYEEDPLWFDEGQTYSCDTCHGRGYFRWCSKCGADLAGMTFTEDADGSAA